jgi:hypothetical protein
MDNTSSRRQRPAWLTDRQYEAMRWFIVSLAKIFDPDIERKMQESAKSAEPRTVLDDILLALVVCATIVLVVTSVRS